MISQSLLSEAYSYKTYRALLEDLLKQGKTTGLDQSEENLNYAKLNLQRMKRLDKTLHLSEEMKHRLQNVQSSYIWLVITEGWCGDAAQNIPAMELIAEACPNIELKLILRDEHPEIMEQYLSNGARSIPKLICLEKESLKECFVWGSRPQELQNHVSELLKKGGTKEEKGLLTQHWYNKDASMTLQKELLSLMKSLN